MSLFFIDKEKEIRWGQPAKVSRLVSDGHCDPGLSGLRLELALGTSLPAA